MESAHTEAVNGASSESRQPFSSKLVDGPQRFLAYAIEHSLACGRRTARDFIRHFSPATIMDGLEDEPQLRANILVTATGVRMKVALKKDANSCGADLQIALDERETDPDTVVALFQPDDRVRFLDNRALWSFLTEGQFWQADRNKDVKGHTLASAHISYLIERALEDQLLTHRDVVRGISVSSMTEYLPRTELPKLIDAALALGEGKKPFLDRDLLAAIGMATLCEYIPLTSIWTRVMAPFVAEAHGLAKRQDEPQQQAQAQVQVHPQAQPQVQPQAQPQAQPPQHHHHNPSDDTLMEEGLMQRVREAAAAAHAAPPAAAAVPALFATAPAPVAAAEVRPPAVARPAFAGIARPPSATTPLGAAKAAPVSADSSIDIEMDDMAGSLGTNGKSAPKKPFRRPGSIPPTA